MAKFLRSIVCHFVDARGVPDPSVGGPRDNANDVWPLAWMYETYATPLPTAGLVKVNVMLAAEPARTSPHDVLGIVEIGERFDTALFTSLTGQARQHYYLERIHQPLLRCADNYQWDPAPLVAAYERIVSEHYRFAFFHKKPLASGNRKRKGQAFIDASSFPARLYLVFFDDQLRETERMLLSVGVDGHGVVEFLLGKLQWQDADTVRVTHANGRDYWLCHADGRVDFHYPRAEQGDPHGQYDLGRMYYDGQWILQDRQRGLELIRSAASKGFPHAVRFLASTNSAGT